MPLLVEPINFQAASAVLGQAGYAIWTAASARVDHPGMAGDDPTGRDWAASFDQAAQRTVTATNGVLNACFQLAGLLEQTGFNYGVAEAASVPYGERKHHADRTPWSEITCSIGVPGSAAGAGSSAPGGWSAIAGLISYAWPNGHQDQLHAAARSWRHVGSALHDVAESTWQAQSSLDDVASPETSAARTACAAMRDHIEQLAAAYVAVGAACDQYAAHLDAAHSEIISALKDFAEQSTWIEVGSAILGFFTGGASEVAGQAVEVWRAGAFAERIGRAIEALRAIIATAKLAIEDVAADLGRILSGVEPLLAARVSVVGVRVVRASEVAKAASAVRMEIRADAALSSAAMQRADVTRFAAEWQWRNPASLARHFSDHAAELGISTLRGYAQEAHRFLLQARQGGFLVKVDSDGMIRVFDPVTNRFASYSRDGETLTFFKPSSPTYWARQPGISQ